MAAPAIAGTPATTNDQTAGTTTAINLPTGITAGETLVILIADKTAIDNEGAIAGWTKLVDNIFATGSGGSCHAFYRKADGTEGATVNYTTTTSTRAAAVAFRVSGAADPTVTAPEAAEGAGQANSVAPNPPAVTPSGGAKDYLVVAFFSSSGGRITSSVPASYTALGTDGGNSGTATNVGIGSAYRQLTAATTEDPGTFATTGAGTEEVSTATIALYPTAAAPNVNGTSSVRGGGALVALASKGGTGTSTARGAGSLAAAARKAALATSAARGGGAIVSVGTAAGAPARSGTSSVRGGGAVASTVRKSSSATSTVRGGGSLTLSSSKGATGASSVRGGGGTVGFGLEGARRATGVTGGGSITSATSKAATGTSSIRGGGSIAGTGTQLQARSGTSSIRGGGIVASSGRKTASSSSTARGGGRLTATGTAAVPRSGVSSIRGGGRLFATATSKRLGSSTLSGGGRLALTWRTSRSSSSRLSGGGGIMGTSSALAPAGPAITSSTRAGPARGITRTSTGSGATLSSVKSGRTRAGSV